MMTQIGMRELKGNFGRFVALLRKNEPVTLKYRGEPLAIVYPIEGKKSPSQTKTFKLLEKLEKKRLISGGKGQVQRKAKPLIWKGKSVADIVIESRE